VGTLIALREPVGESYGRLARAFGVAVPAGRLEEAFRRIFAGAPPMAFPGRSPEEAAREERVWWRDRVRETFRAADQMQRFDDFDGFFERLWSHFADSTAWRVLPGAVAVLDQLAAQDHPLAMVSNFDLRLPRLLDALSLAERFNVILLPGHCGFAKPDPRIFHEACARLRRAPERCTYVGDHPEDDVAGAIAAGLQAIDVGTLATLQELVPRIERDEGGSA
jgi:putative hydrolase of the HAD superfamily